MRNGLAVAQTRETNGLPITRIETIADGFINSDRVGYAGLRENDCANWLLQRGDILFSHINSTSHLGKVAIYEGHPAKLVHGMNLLCIRPDAERVNAKYLLYALRSSDFRQQLLRIIKPAVNQASIAITDLKHVKLAIPPLKEQLRIAEILDKVDTLRAKRRAALAQLDSLTESIFLDMFGPGGHYERSSSLVPLSAVCRVITDGVHKTPAYVEKGIPFVTVKNITSGVLDLSETKKILQKDHETFTKRTKPEKGDVLVSKDGTIGIPCPVETGDDFSIFVSVALLKLKADVIEQSFLTAQFRSDWIQRQIRRNSKGIAIRHLHLVDFKRLSVIVPPLSLQSEFARCIRELERHKSLQITSLLGFNTLFASLQHRAFRGEL